MGNICICGKEKREDRLICPRCLELYRTEAKRQKITMMEWAKTKALKTLAELGISEEDPQIQTTLERKLKAKRKELQAIEESLSGEVRETLKKRLFGAGRLRKDEMEVLRKDIREELWKAKGGPKLYAELKELEREVQQRVFPLREVLREIEKTEKNQVLLDRLFETIDSTKDQ